MIKTAFETPHPDLQLTDNTQEEKQAATRVIHHNATGARDLCELLEMMGLTR